jgi:hypothetical protein
MIYDLVIKVPAVQLNVFSGSASTMFFQTTQWHIVLADMNMFLCLYLFNTNFNLNHFCFTYNEVFTWKIRIVIITPSLM